MVMLLKYQHQSTGSKLYQQSYPHTKIVENVENSFNIPIIKEHYVENSEFQNSSLTYGGELV